MGVSRRDRCPKRPFKLFVFNDVRSSGNAHADTETRRSADTHSGAKGGTLMWHRKSLIRSSLSPPNGPTSGAAR